MRVVAANPVLPVVSQHAEDAAALRSIRSVLLRAPHVKLLHLSRHDERIAAHIDGLRVAGAMGAALCREQMAAPSTGAVFAAAVLAIESGDRVALDHLIAIAKAEPMLCDPGLLSAFGWVPPTVLRGVTKELLDADDPFHRRLGLASCELQGVLSEPALAAALEHGDTSLRTRALRGAGRLGCVSLLPAVLTALTDNDEACRFEAACAAAMLGERDRSVAELWQQASHGCSRRTSALIALMQVIEPREVRAPLKQLSESEADLRLLIRCVGMAGDPHFVPWLLSQTDVPARAQLAGEALSLIVGLDLASADLDLPTPPEVDTSRHDDPADDNVALDEDESLPWPEPTKLRAWWQTNRPNFTAGVRHFAGRPLSRKHCVQVLKKGSQRQRVAAAHHLALLCPSTALFNCAAPAWRQYRLLVRMA